MHRPAAAKSDQDKIARVVSPPDRNQLQGVDHIGVCDADHPHRRLLNADGERVSDRPHGRLSLFLIQGNFTPQEIVRVNAPGNYVGVGDGRLVAAPSVAGRSRVCTRAHGAHPQGARLVDPGDRAASCADLDDIDRGGEDGIAGEIPAVLDLVFCRDLGGAVFDQRGFRCCAADVKRDDIRLTGKFANMNGAGDTCYRP